MMQHENEFEIHLNANGNPDVDYYVEKAHQMRNQAIVDGLQALKRWIHGASKSAWSRPEGDKGAPQQVAQSGWPWVDLILETHPRRKAGHV
jgi:hypothetical protein